MAKTQEQPRICPLLSIAVVGRAPSAIVSPIDQKPQGQPLIACLGMSCMLFVPVVDEEHGNRIVGGNCAFAQLAISAAMLNHGFGQAAEAVLRAAQPPAAKG